MNPGKFWSYLRAIAKMFDFTVMIKFEDAVIKDFKIYKESEVEDFEA